jgi:hypothetical protein
MFRHSIPSLRPSSSFNRLQILTSLLLRMGEDTYSAIREINLTCSHMQLSTHFVRLFENAVAKIDDNKKVVEMFPAGMLPAQAKLMEDYYSKSASTLARTLEEDIYEIILAIEEVKKYCDDWLKSGVSTTFCNSLAKLRQAIDNKTQGRINDETDPLTFVAELDKLLIRANQTRSDWITAENEPTPLFIKHKERYSLQSVVAIKHQIWEILLDRRLHLNALHGSSTLGIPASMK